MYFLQMCHTIAIIYILSCIYIFPTYIRHRNGGNTSTLLVLCIITYTFMIVNFDMYFFAIYIRRRNGVTTSFTTAACIQSCTPRQTRLDSLFALRGLFGCIFVHICIYVCYYMCITMCIWLYCYQFYF